MEFLLILCFLLVFLLTGAPIFAALGLISVGLSFWSGSSLSSMADVLFGSLNVYDLVAIPLFAFMAHVLIKSGVMDDLFNVAYTFVRHLPGGMGIAAVASCTVFAAISGSSVATALTVGATAIPQMKRFGYPESAIYGAVAAGGALGILIPPSGAMILYAVITNASIGAMFIAGIIPGLMLSVMFSLWCMYYCRKVKREPASSWGERWRMVRRALWALLLPPFVLGGIYLGVFTATEPAGIGAILALAIAVLVYRTVTVKDVLDAASEAAQMSTMLFLLVGAAAIFSHSITRMRVPFDLLEAFMSLHLGAAAFILAAMALIIVLGMFLEGISIILITTPMVLPALAHFNVDLVWYGILLVINLELAMITPPVGMNLFVIKALADTPMQRIITGAAPYMLLMLIGLLLIFAVPSIALWLPHHAGFS